MADDEQFSLCWNNFNTNLSAGFHESLVRGDLVDVTLAAEGQLVKAHRLILSVCSPYFRKMFTQMPANQHAFIFLKDVSHSALKDLIQFMYCGEVNVKQDALPAFISTAEALQIKGLTETGESAPTQQPSPAKEASHLPSASSTTIPSLASSPRAKPIVRSRIQSYKLDSDDGSDHEKVVQIQATSTPASVASASSSTVTTQVSVPQQVQILQQPTPQAQKRTIQQRASITPQQTAQVMKRAKLTDPLEASEPTQIQTVQIVKQITPTPQPSISSEPEYVEMPIETINPKAEPEYADDPSEVEAIETEHEQEQSLAEQEATEHDQAEDDSAHYVEDETYGDMSKYDETYFAEGDDPKAGASGFSESYAESGTGADQAAQAKNDVAYVQTKQVIDAENPTVQYIATNKSRRLIVNGHSFTRKKRTERYTIWECCQSRLLGCKAAVTTYLDNAGAVNIRGSHNHAVVTERRRLGQRKQLMEERQRERIQALVHRATQLKATLRQLKRDQNRRRSPTRSERIRQVQRLIRQLDSQFRQISDQDLKKPVRVNGFTFPLSCEEDIERLELMVQRNPSIREQFVNYLCKRKSFSDSVEKCFGNFFTDEAMLRYNWRGLDRDQYPRKAMMNYSIFTDCMVDAWSSHGVSMQMIHSELRKAVFKIGIRQYSNKCDRIQRFLERTCDFK